MRVELMSAWIAASSSVPVVSRNLVTPIRNDELNGVLVFVVEQRPMAEAVDQTPEQTNRGVHHVFTRQDRPFLLLLLVRRTLSPSLALRG